MTHGPSAAFDSVLALLEKQDRDPVTLEPDDLADGAMWMLDQALTLVRSASRPKELLEAANAMLTGPDDDPAGTSWALGLVRSELLGERDEVDEAITEALSARPTQSWVALARTLAAVALLHDGEGAAAWLRSRKPQA